MHPRDRLLQRVLRDTIVPLAVSAAQIKANMPSRIGGYSFSLRELLPKMDRDRITLGLINDTVTHVKWLTGDSADSVVYDKGNEEIVVEFNGKLELSEKYVHFGCAAAQRR